MILWQAFEYPVRINEAPRPIPKQPVYMQPISGIIMGGILPFGCILLHLFFILNSIHTNQMHYMFGLAFVDFCFFIVTCALTSIFLCFLHLRTEDYNWWWRSFLTTGITAFYVFVFCWYVFATQMAIDDIASTIVYFGYTLIMVFFFFLLTGTIGFVACFWFIRRIYGVVNIDSVNQIEINI